MSEDTITSDSTLDIRELARRVQLLEDQEAIQDLGNAYHALGCERDYKAMTELFAPDAVVDYGEWGVCKGHAEIEKMLWKAIADDDWVPFTKQFLQNFRYVVNPDGKTGTGRRYLFSTVVWLGKSTVCTARFDDEYVKRDGRWYFLTTKVEVDFWTPIADGWDNAGSVGGHLSVARDHMHADGQV
jgi:hypothetical protein